MWSQYGAWRSFLTGVHPWPLRWLLKGSIHPLCLALRTACLGHLSYICHPETQQLVYMQGCEADPGGKLPAAASLHDVLGSGGCMGMHTSARHAAQAAARITVRDWDMLDSRAAEVGLLWHT